MNELYTREFISQALNAGVAQEKIAAILERADQISRRSVKTASNTEVSLIDALLCEAKFEKTASSEAYAQGILGEALASGATLHQAAQFTKQALDATQAKITFLQKVSAIANDSRLSNYADGFIEFAKKAGLDDDSALALLVETVDVQKQANFGGHPGAHAGQGGPGGAPGADAGGAGAPPMAQDGIEGPSMNGDMQQILQQLEQLPPEIQQQIIQQLLAATQGGGQGGGQPSPAAAPAHAAGHQGPAQ